MKVTSEDLKSLYQEETARSSNVRVACLPVESMLRAATGESSEEERVRVADHLATCSNCAWEFRLVRAFKPWAEEAGEALAGQRPTFRGGEKVIDQQPPLRRKGVTALPLGRTPVALVTQLMLLALLTLGGWLILTRQANINRIRSLNEQVAERDRALESANRSIEETRRQLEEAIRRRDQALTTTNSKQSEEEITRLRQAIDGLSNPQLDVPIVELEMIRGGSIETALPIEVPRNTNLVTLILNFGDRQQYSIFELEIFDQRGTRVWRGQRKSQVNKLNLILPRQFLSGGRYLIKLFGLRNDKQVPIADYAVNISYK